MTPEQTIVSSHVITRIFERTGHCLSTRKVSEILSDPKACLGPTKEGVRQYAGPGFVVMAVKSYGRQIAVTALAPYMAIENALEESVEGLGKKWGRSSWRNEVVRAASWGTQVRRRTGVRLSQEPARVSKTSDIPGFEDRPFLDALALQEALAFQEALVHLPEKVTDPRDLKEVPEAQIDVPKESAHSCFRARMHLQMTRRELALRLGVRSTMIKRIECGKLQSLPVALANKLRETLLLAA